MYGLSICNQQTENMNTILTYSEIRANEELKLITRAIQLVIREGKTETEAISIIGDEQYTLLVCVPELN